jgi:hypothetical protein
VLFSLLAGAGAILEFRARLGDAVTAPAAAAPAVARPAVREIA